MDEGKEREKYTVVLKVDVIPNILQLSTEGNSAYWPHLFCLCIHLTVFHCELHKIRCDNLTSTSTPTSLLAANEVSVYLYNIQASVK
jgi:hypothetical protein